MLTSSKRCYLPLFYLFAQILSSRDKLNKTSFRFLHFLSRNRNCACVPFLNCFVVISWLDQVNLERPTFCHTFAHNISECVHKCKKAIIQSEVSIKKQRREYMYSKKQDLFEMFIDMIMLVFTCCTNNGEVS